MRYRLKLATWIVHREPGQPSPRLLSSPEAVALFARDLLHTADDDKEHFWAIYLNTQNHYPTPSGEDLRLTRQLADGARLLDLRLHDHIIIGNGTEQWVSLAQRGDL
jgi:DNA repair protein RadC